MIRTTFLATDDRAFSLGDRVRGADALRLHPSVGFCAKRKHLS